MDISLVVELLLMEYSDSLEGRTLPPTHRSKWITDDPSKGNTDSRAIYDVADALYLNPKYQIKPRAWVAGGAIRNTLLGLRSNDIDIWVANRDATILNFLGERGYKDILNLGCYSTPFEEATLHKLVKLPDYATNWDNLIKIDLILAGLDATPEKTILNFDYTINAVAFDLSTRKFIHHRNFLKDLHNRVLRLVHPSAMKMVMRRKKRLKRFVEMGFKPQGELKDVWEEVKKEGTEGVCLPL